MLIIIFYFSFGNDTLFGLAPELSPVYRHVLYLYRSKNPTSKIGDPISSGGYPGLNSGVILFCLDRLRNSSLYAQLIHAANVTTLAKKYSFKVCFMTKLQFAAASDLFYLYTSIVNSFSNVLLRATLVIKTFTHFWASSIRNLYLFCLATGISSYAHGGEIMATAMSCLSTHIVKGRFMCGMGIAAHLYLLNKYT